MTDSAGSDAAKTVRSEGLEADLRERRGPSLETAAGPGRRELPPAPPRPRGAEATPRPPASVPRSSGFQAFLQHANLHNLLQIESLSRTTGVFLVVSQGRRGYLHLCNGDLVHAETDGFAPEAAAAEILSWGEGEFSSCDRTLAPLRTIDVNIPTLLLRLAKAQDEASQYPERKVTEPSSSEGRARELRATGGPALHAEAEFTGMSAAPEPAVAAQLSSDPARSATDALRRAEPAGAPDVVSEAAPASRSMATLAEVTVTASGEITEGRGPGLDEFAARVAYAARLAELVGRAIRSGTPRAVELRGKSTQTSLRWQADGNLSATLEAVQGSRSK